MKENMCAIQGKDLKEKPKKRYHVNVEFFHSPLALGLFDIYQICDLACSLDYEVPLHDQLCYEISYIVSGEGTFFRNNIPYKVSPEMIFLLNMQDTHYIKSSKSNPLRYMCIGFTFHKDHVSFRNFENLCSFFDNLKNPLATDRHKLFELFSYALSEISKPDSFSMDMFESYILQIIVHTYRTFNDQILTPYTNLIETELPNPVIYEIINYIDTNITTIQRLTTDISNAFNYTYEYLSKIFSQTMEFTIKSYYRQRLLEKAIEMLAQDMTVTEISQQLHFSDMSAFCKAFKQYYHISPKKYQLLIGKTPL